MLVADVQRLAGADVLVALPIAAVVLVLRRVAAAEDKNKHKKIAYKRLPDQHQLKYIYPLVVAVAAFVLLVRLRFSRLVTIFVQRQEGRMGFMAS